MLPIPLWDIEILTWCWQLRPQTLIPDWRLPWGYRTPVLTTGETDTYFTTGCIPQSSVDAACSLCLNVLSGFSQFSFWFALRNVTSGDLDWPSKGFYTLGGFSIGPRCLFLRDTLADYAKLGFKLDTRLIQKHFFFFKTSKFFILYSLWLLSVAFLWSIVPLR